MHNRLFKAGVISIGALIGAQIIRFAANILLAKLLAPSAFGVVAIVNMLMLGINLFSDIGLRQVVIQRQGMVSREFLNTIWVIQIARGFIIWLVAIVLAVVLLIFQQHEIATQNAYADRLLPYLIAGAASSALFLGFESTKSHMMYKTLNLRRITAIDLSVQVLSTTLMVSVAYLTASPWALVVGSVTAALFKCAVSHLLLPGERNSRFFDKVLAFEILKKSRWILLSSPLTFFELNGAVMILGGLLVSAELGLFMIAFLIVGVVQLVSQNLASNVFFPGLSTAVGLGRAELRKKYCQFQIVADIFIVTSSGILISGGQSFVYFLFDDRYTPAGDLLSILAIGLIGIRFCVVEQLINANGEFKLGPPTIIMRVAAMVLGITIGYSWAGLQGAAAGIALSWFAGWPILVGYRSRQFGWPWKIDMLAVVFLGIGYGLGMLVTQMVTYFHIRIPH